MKSQVTKATMNTVQQILISEAAQDAAEEAAAAFDIILFPSSQAPSPSLYCGTNTHNGRIYTTGPRSFDEDPPETQPLQGKLHRNFPNGTSRTIFVR